jgi:branched-chain amino acid transport system substrate-binding protein
VKNQPSKTISIASTGVACALMVATALTLSACGGGEGDPDWSGTRIEIGSIFSTSGIGTAYGPQQLKAVKLAIEEVNGDDGLNGAKLTLMQRNDRSDPARSASEMKDLIRQEEVLAVLGPTFSNSAAEADPVANRLSTPVLAVSNTGPGIVGDCPYPCDFIFRDSLGEETAIPANVGEAVSGSGGETAAIVHPQGDPFGETTAGIAEEAFRQEGIEVIASTETPAGLDLAIQARPDVLMITASSGDAAADLIIDARSKGFTGVILGGNAFNSEATSRAAGRDGRGAQSAAAWFEGNGSTENREFITAYRAAWDEAPDQFAAQAYTGVLILAEAIEDADLGFTDLAADRVALRDEIESVELNTPLGEFSFTSDRDVSQPIWIVEMDGKGGFELVRELPPPKG